MPMKVAAPHIVDREAAERAAGSSAGGAVICRRQRDSGTSGSERARPHRSDQGRPSFRRTARSSARSSHGLPARSAVPDHPGAVRSYRPGPGRRSARRRRPRQPAGSCRTVPWSGPSGVLSLELLGFEPDAVLDLHLPKLLRLFVVLGAPGLELRIPDLESVLQLIDPRLALLFDAFLIRVGLGLQGFTLLHQRKDLLNVDHGNFCAGLCWAAAG